MKKDLLSKEFYSDDSRFADIINGIGCMGEQVVCDTDLSDMDTQTGIWRIPQFIRNTGKTGHKRDSFHVRDLVRKTAFGMNFAIIGIENQDVIDYSMPLRSLSYDTGEYEYQAAKTRKFVRKNSAGLGRGEYLYGFRKDSRLYPVATFILYYGEEPWDGALDLHGLLNFDGIPEPLRAMVSNYRINLIDIRRLKDTSMFHTDVKQVFDFIRFSKDPEALRELVLGDASYKELEEDTYDMIAQYSKSEELVEVKDYHKKDGVVDMCEALTKLIENGKSEGRAEGRLEGRFEGRLEGITEGKAFEVYESVQEGDYSIERGAQKLGITVEELEKRMIEAGYKLPVEA